MDTSAGEKVALITTKSLTKRYRVGGHDLLATNNVSLSINRGEFVAIVGESGSGKSTLLQLLGGLDKPTSGLIVVNGVEVTGLSDGKLSQFRNRTIGFVFQSFYLQPFLTLRRNIEVAAMPGRGTSGELGLISWLSKSDWLIGWTIILASYQVDRSNEWQSPEHYSISHRSCWLMSRPAISTHRIAEASLPYFGRSVMSWVRLWWW